MGKLNSLGNRIVALALCLILVISMLPSGAIAEGNGNDVVLGTVEALTNGTVTGNGTANVNVEVKDATLQWVAADESIGRYQDGWWAGINVTAPAGFSANATYKMATKVGAEFGEEKSFTANKDTEDTIGLWMPISAESLSKFASEDRNLTLVYAFDWNADGDYEQTIVFAVDPTSIVLQKNGVQVYPFGTVEALTNGTVTGNGTGNVEVLIKDATLQWVAADESIGRYQDGYWAGINVTAPAGFSENATYKMATKVGAEFGETKKFADNRDTDTTIGLWMPISAESLSKFASEDRNLTLVYAFDWNADGDFEQTIIFAVDPNTITLEENGVQVYPPLGTVETLTNGTVTGNGTGNVEVLIKDATLQWVAANDEIGRYQDGYWAGINVTAPAGFSANATYKMATKVGAEFGETKKFADNRDTDTTIGLWMPITAESLDKFISETRNLTLVYAFDWDADGDYEQTIIFAVDPNTITLEENGVQVYPPLGTVETLTNGTVTGNGTGNVEVLIKDATLQWVAANDEIGRYQDGWWAGINVTAPAGFSENATYKMATKVGAEFGEAKSFAANKDTEDTIGLWMPITAESLDKFISETRNLTLVYAFDWDADGDYEQTIIFAVDPNTITLEENGVQVYPPLGTVETLTGGTITGNATSEVTVVIDEVVLNWSEADDSIGRAQGWWVGINVIAPEGFSAEATYKIKTGPNVDFGAAKEFADYHDGENNIQLWFPVSPESLAKFKAENRDLVMTYAFDWNNDGDYEQTIIFSVVPSEKIVLNTKEWKPFNFEKDADEITYAPELTYTKTLVGKDETVVFEIVDEKYEGADADVADIDAATGKLTIKQAGTVTVRATREADKWYDKATAEYTLTVNKADQTFVDAGAFAQDVSLTYGAIDFTKTVELNTPNSGIEIVYTGNNDTLATVDAATGKVTFKDNQVGEIIVTASVAGDDCYNAASIEYTITVAYLDDATMPSVENKWYTEAEITVSAPEGYTVSKTGKLDAVWSNEVTFTAADGLVDGDSNSVNVYLRNADGHITDVKTISGIKIDTQAPTDLSITYKDPSGTVILESDEIDIFGDEELTVTISAKDATSGIAGLSYSKNGLTFTAIEENDLVRGEDGTVTAEFTIPAEFRGKVTMKATDIAKNNVVKTGDKIIVLDTIDPSHKVNENTYSAGTEDVHRWENGILYSQGDVTVFFNINEVWADLSGLELVGQNGDKTPMPVLTVNGNEEQVTNWNFADGYLSGSYTLSGNGDYVVNLTYTDAAGNPMEAFEQEIRIDNDPPVIDITYDNNDVHNESYYDADRTATILITEHNFKPEEVELVVKVNGEVIASYTDAAKDANNWTSKAAAPDVHYLTISKFAEEADYEITVNYTDLAKNAAVEKTDVFTVDKVDPVIEIIYDDTNATESATNEGYFKGYREAIIKVIEGNFKVENVELSVTAKNIIGEEVNYVLNSASWKYLDATGAYVDNVAQAVNPDEHYLILPAFNLDAVYELSIKCTDLAGRVNEQSDGFTVDNTAPDAGSITISYSNPVGDAWIEDGNNLYPYKESVTVTVRADDITSGVDYFTWTYTKEEGSSDKNAESYGEKIPVEKVGKTATASFTIPANARGHISVLVTDKANNTSGKSDDNRINVVDKIAPNRTVSYKPKRVLDAETLMDVENFAEGDNVILYYEKEAVVTFIIDEANFYAEDVEIQVNGEKVVPTDWTQSGDIWTGTITISGDGDYVVTMTYTDRSTNEMVAYQSQKIAIDDTDPTIKVEYNNNTALNNNNYKKDRTATITIVDHNFRADDVTVTVTAKDIQGNVVEVTDFAEYLSKRDSWTSNGDTHVAKITYSTDAIYTFDISYADIIGNEAADFAKETFVVDKTAPENIQIKYSKSVVDKILEAVTFGFYKSKVTVTLTADDITSGVDYFTWTYTKEEGSSDKNMDDVTKVITTENITYSNGGKTATATFVIEAQARGYISVDVTDMAGNTAKTNDKKNTTIIVDDIAPEISVVYDAAKADVQYVNKDLVTVDSFQEATNAYFGGNVTAKVVINEANFFEGVKDDEGNVIHNVGIKVTKTDDDGNVTVYEYLPEGAEQKYTKATAMKITWTTSGDEHTATIKFEDDGDYVLEIKYTDLSKNNANISASDGKTATKTYKSKVITVDKTKPVISVEYGSKDAITTSKNGREYYGAVQTATITVIEHNFRADDFVATITAKDLLGNDVNKANVAKFVETVADDSKWTKDGNTYTIKLKYSVDANYTVDFKYQDLAQNSAKIEKYNKRITVDKTAPTDLKITYSESVVDKILGAITFGFYKPEVKVTLTADDITSGVDYFEWTYTKGKNTSDKNTASYGGKIEAKDIVFSNDGKTATATFTIPANARGYISASVTDKAGNTAETSDENKTTVVVDKIAPGIKVEYDKADRYVNENLVDVKTFKQAAIAYYKGGATAKIVIDEANFFEGVKDDEGNVIHNVGIKVTKTDDDGNVTVYEYLPEGAEQKYTDAKAKKITWSTSGDEHTATIKFEDDGDYVLEIKYTDLSKNRAKTYKSKVITVDKTKPVISVEYGNKDVITTSKNGRKYYNAVQTATITVVEHNFRADDFVATITAKDLLGNDVTKANVAKRVDTLKNDSKWEKNGNTYEITIEFPVDANYTFEFKYQDLAKNSAKIKKYDKRFTVDKTAPEMLDIKYESMFTENNQELGDDSARYYGGVVNVTLTATDNISGVNMIEYSYLLADNVSSVNAQMENVTVTPKQIAGTADFEVTFTIPLKKLTAETQFNGYVKFTAEDKSKKSTEKNHKEEKIRVVVDNIPPEGKIEPNTEDKGTLNGVKYFDGPVTSTVTITEANFHKDEVIVKVDNATVKVDWDETAVGDTHVGTFTVTGDGRHEVTMEYTDRSGNKMEYDEVETWIIDTKDPVITVSGIKHQSANNAETIGFVVTVTDKNLLEDGIEPKLRVVAKEDIESKEERTLSFGEPERTINGEGETVYTYTIDNLDEDAYYILTWQVTDLANHIVTDIISENLDGEAITTQEIHFSVNRKGSVFKIETEHDVDGQYINGKVSLVITEINVDKVDDGKTVFTLNNGSSAEDVTLSGDDYKKNEAMSDVGGWYQTTYTLNESMFAKDGVYSISIITYDAAGNINVNSKNEEGTISFVVDRTKPVISANLISKQIINDTQYKVYFQITDLNLNPETIKVIYNGEPVTLEDLGNNEYSFVAKTGLNQSLEISASDLAGNESDVYQADSFTISTNALVRWYATGFWFWFPVIGAPTLIGLAILLIVLKKKK